MSSFSRVGIIGNPHKAGIEAAVQRIIEWCDVNGSHALLDSSLERYGFSNEYLSRIELANSAEMVVALGGDGTILAASRLLAERGVPLLGINMGGLGFLTVKSAEQLDQVLDLIDKGSYSMEERMMLEGEVVGPKPCSGLLALNDFVIGHGAMARIFDLSVTVTNDS